MQLTAIPGGQREATPNPRRDLTSLTTEQARLWRDATIERRIANAGFPQQLVADADWSHRGLEPKWQRDGRTNPAVTARGWAAQNPPRGIFGLQGPVGCGKSTLAVLTAMLAVQQSQVERALYATCLGLLGEWGRRATDSEGRPKGVSQAPWDTDLLVLDELKAPRGMYPSVISLMADLINTRWQRGLATIVTTNVADAEQIGKLYGYDILSRLNDVRHNAALVWSPDAPDWRGVSEQ